MESHDPFSDGDTHHVTLICSQRPPQQCVSECPADCCRPAAVLQQRGHPGPAGRPQTPVWGAGHQRRHVSRSWWSVCGLPHRSQGLSLLCFFSHSPLHLAIIHQQTAVIHQLIQTLLSSQQQSILNTANHLLQVEPAPPTSCLLSELS